MKKENYHLGDVKNKLLNLAIKKIEEVGVDKLSIRELARELGLSKNAPYKHFKSKEELLAAVANFGFIKIHKMMSEELNKNKSFKENLEAMGNSYIKFSKEYPSIYKTMFIMTSKKTFDQSYGDNAASSFMLLMDFVSEGIKSGIIKEQDSYKVSLSIWAYIHGCASFHIDNIGIPFSHGENSKKIFDIDFITNCL